MEDRLTASARNLFGTLRESPAYSEGELRAYAADRMRNDEELHETIGDDELLGRLIDIVGGPAAD